MKTNTCLSFIVLYLPSKFTLTANSLHKLLRSYPLHKNTSDNTKNFYVEHIIALSIWNIPIRSKFSSSCHKLSMYCILASKLRLRCKRWEFTTSQIIECRVAYAINLQSTCFYVEMYRNITIWIDSLEFNINI